MTKKADWISIGKLKKIGSTKASLKYRLTCSDTVYFLFMKNFTKREEKVESHFFGVKFSGIDDTFEKFYELLKSFFLDENRKNKNYSQTFRLGEKMVNLQHYPVIKGKGIMVSTNEGYIDKLFGKR